MMSFSLLMRSLMVAVARAAARVAARVVMVAAAVAKAVVTMAAVAMAAVPMAAVPMAAVATRLSRLEDTWQSHFSYQPPPHRFSFYCTPTYSPPCTHSSR